MLQVWYPMTVAAQTVILPDGRTQTTVGRNGAAWDVGTATMRGGNAFNSFSAFSVGSGSVVNLHVPTAAAHLINIVRDQRTDIDGMLNAVKDGKIGGNVWFANPHGLVVGQGGVVNVGSLTVATPTQAFVDNFFSAPGVPDDAAVARLLGGTAPRNAAAMVSILGRINAGEGISLSAGAINVAGSIYSGARFIGSAPDFSDVVNANGLSAATNVMVREGRIEIVADSDVTVSGTLAAPGGPGVRGGDIVIRAGGDVDLQPGALVTARGFGANSAGGTVNIWADNNATFRTGAAIDASAGTSGDGGAIEFSAQKTVELAGGEFRADATSGAAGFVLVDPFDITLTSNIYMGGANYSLVADNSITVNSGVVVSTRNVTGGAGADQNAAASVGNSGHLSMQAGTIELASGSMLLAHATGGFTGGDVTLTATRGWTGEAKISLDGATLKGKNISLAASASYDDSILTSWLPVVVPVTVATIDVNAGSINASGTLTLGATSLINVSSSGLSPLGSITAVSAASVDVHGASVLTAGGNTSLAASSTVTSKATPGGPNLATLPGDAGVATNLIVSTARTHVGDSSSVTVSGGTLDLSAKNVVTATTKADATAGGAVAIGGTLALSEVTSVTQAVIDGSATTSSSALKVGAESTSTVTTSAKAASKGAKKQTAAEKAANPSKSEAALAKYKDQTSTSDGSVDVAAAVAIANVNNITLADIASTGTQTATGATTVSSKATTASTVTADGSSAGGTVGVGAAVGANIGVLVNQARVADMADISSAGLTVSAVMSPDSAKNSFVTTATSGAGASNVGVAGALGTNVLVNTTVASIEGDADANSGDLVVEAVNTSESKVTVGATVKPATATQPAAVGVGASVGMNVAVNTTVAEIGDGADVTGARNVGLTAKGGHVLSNAVTGGAAGADISVTPVAAITVAVNTTTARLGTGSLLDLSGAFSGSADQTSSSTATATGQTQGNNVAVGASIALNSSTDTVAAAIDRDVAATGEVAIGAKSTAQSGATATASAKGGEKAAAGDTPPAEPDGSAGKTVDEKVTAQGDAAKAAGKKTADTAGASSPAAAGLAAAAASSDPDTKKAATAAAANSPTAAGAAVAAASNDSKTKVDQTQEAPKTEDNSQGGGGVSVAAAVGVNAGIATTTATVGKGRTITSSGGALKVTSVNQTDVAAKADGSQVDSGNTDVGIGAAVALNVGISTNVAVVGDNAVVNTKGLTISAVNAADEKSDYAAEAKSGAGAGNVGVAGSLAANVVVNTTVAALEGDTDNSGSGASVNAGAGLGAGDILIEAANATTSTVKSGADVKGTDDSAKVGVGASIGANIAVNTTVAEVADKAVLTGGNNLGLNAKGNHSLTTDVTGGAAGAQVAVTPLVAATVAVNTTSAKLGESATDIGIAGKYSSTAEQTSSATTTATGQTEGSSVAIGASIGLTIATDTVVAAIERDITATNGIELNAKSEAKSSTTATASAKGGEKAKDDGTAPAPGGGAGSGQSVDQKVAAQGDAAKASGKTAAAKAPATTPAAGSSASAKLDAAKPAPKSEESTESGGVAVAAAVGVNAGIATTTAQVGKGLNISSSGGALKVTSTNQTDASAKADGSQVDPGNTDVGIGAAVALNVGISTNVAAVGENATVNTKGLTISAVNATGEKSDYAAEAKSGAGAGNVGVAGSLAANVVVNTTVATLEGDSSGDADTQGAIVNAGGGDILIEAANATTSTVKSGADVKGTGGTAKVGVGASLGMNVGVNTTVAEAGDRSEITNGKDFGLNAKADHTLTTDVTGGAAGAKVAVTPLVAATIAVNTTSARLGESPATAGLSGKYSSTAEQASSATTTATGQTQGSSVAVGASIGLTVAVDTVTADVERDITAATGVEVNAKSEAKSSTTATASVKGGEKAKDDGSPPAPDGGSGSGQTVDQKVAGQQDKATAAGKATAAKAPATTPAAGSTASDKLDTNKQAPPKAETSEGGVSVAAAVGVNVGVATTTATIGRDRTIASGGALKVTSTNQTDAAAKADGSQVDTGNTDVGIGAAVALNVGVATNVAKVGDDSTVTAKGVTVSALTPSGQKNDFAAEAKSGAGAGNVGVAGSLAANVVVNTSYAGIEGDANGNGTVTGVDAGTGADADVLIAASNASTSTVTTSADVKGTDDSAKVGVGASLGVNVAVNTTTAEVGNGAALTRGDDLSVTADADHTLKTTVTGGAAGAKVSITPVVAATIAVNTTTARVGTGTTALNPAGTLKVSAQGKDAVTTTATGQAQGDVAVGASLAASIAVDNVSASVERNVTSSAAIDLDAKSALTLDTTATAGAKGAKEKKKADGTHETGTTVDEQKKNQLDFAKGRNSAAGSVNTDTKEAKTPDTNKDETGGSKESGKKVSVAAAIGVGVAYNGAQASIGPNVSVGTSGKLSINAATDTDYKTKASGEAVSDNIGIAAAVGLTATMNKTQANLGSGSTVTQAGDIEIGAVSKQNRGSGHLYTMGAEAMSGASGGDVAVAGALAVVANDNETRASIDEGANVGSVTPVGDIKVTAEDESRLAAAARAGALSKGGESKAGVGASFAVLLANNKNIAAIGYDADKNGASPVSTIRADSATVSALKRGIEPISFSLSAFKDVKNFNFDALDPANYLGINYYSEAVAGAAAKGDAAVSGSFAVNVFGNTTEASIGKNVHLTTSGSQPAGELLGVEVKAQSDTKAVAFAGAVAAAKKAGVGISNTDIINLDQTVARIGQGATVLADHSVKVSSAASQNLANVSVSAAAATENTAVGGVLGVVVSLNKSQALIDEGATVKSLDDVAVSAANDSTMVMISGGLGGAKEAGVGAAIAVNIVKNDTEAAIGKDAVVDARNDLTVAADADETAVTATLAGAGGGKAGVAAALSLNTILTTTIASVGEGAKLNNDAAYANANQAVALTARDDTVIVGVAGGGAGGGKAGVGAALDTAVLAKTVKAYVADDADGLNVASVKAAKNVTVDAASTDNIVSVTMGFAGGGSVGVGGAVSVGVVKDDVEAYIGKSASVDSDGNVLVNAQNDVTAVLTSGAGAGGGNTGVGASLAVATLLGTTKAHVGENATVNARGNRDAATVYTGDTVITLQPDSPAMPGDLLAKKTESAKGLSVTAYNRENLITTVVGGAGGGTAGVAATVSANVIANTTEAWIGRGAQVNASNGAASSAQQVRVKAVDETLLINTAGAGAGGGSAGVGAAANVGVVAKTTKAWIGQSALVNAKQAVELDASASALTFTTTAGFAGGGSAGVGGAVAGVGVADTTMAYVEDGTSAANAAKINVTGGDLTLNATDFATSWLVTGAGAGGGAAGVGGSLAVGVNASTTKAKIGNYAETNASGDTEVHADSTENVNTITVAGAGGGSAGVSGTIGVNVIVAKTEAGIGDHAKVNQVLAGHDVDVKATDRIISVAASGAGAGGGAAGVGGTANATVALNTTSAYVGSGASVSAANDVKVAASSEKYVNAAAVAGAGGGAAGVAGAASIIAVGSLLDGEAKSGLRTQDESGNTVSTQSQADGQTTKSAVGGMLGTSTQSTETKGVLDSNAGKLAVSPHLADTATVPLRNTQAFVGFGADVNAGRDVAVSASDTTLAIVASGAGAGGGAAGVAGSVGVVLLHDSAEAFIADGAAVDAARTIAVDADTAETVVNIGITGCGGGAAGVCGSGSVNVVTSATSAYIGDADINQGSVLNTGRSVEVQAGSQSNLIAVAGSGGGAGAAAVGGVLNVNTLFKTTKAYIGEGASVAADKDVKVAAESAQNIVSAGLSIQGAGAAAVGGAATVNVVGNTTEAYIGSARDDATKTAARVDSDGNVVIAASDDTLLIAVSGSGTGAGAAAVGGAVAANVISSQTRAYVGDNTAINARGNAVGASVDTGTINNAAAGALPSLPAGASGDVDVDNDGVNDGNVASGASFSLAGGSTSTTANPASVKDSQGNSVGSATGGLGTKGKETAKGLSVTATGNEKIISAAVGVAGAGAAGVTGTATADVIVSQTEASIGDGAQINQTGAVGSNSDVRVRAADNSLVVMASGTVAGAAGAGVSGSANVAVIAKQTHAAVGDADIKAHNVAVQAAGREDVFVVDANVSFGAAGVGGAAGVAVVTNDTQAGIAAGATVDATGGIAVNAAQDTSLDIYTVAGSAGIGAVSGAFSIGVIDNTTRAYVGDGTALKHATLDAAGTTEVAATSREEITTGTASAAGGGVGVAGAVGVKVVTSETTAEIGDYASINQTRRGAAQDVKVGASDTVELGGGGGSGAVGSFFGAGATAEVNVVRNTTTASVGNYASIRADRDIEVAATSTKDVEAQAYALAGGIGGVAGAVALAFVGASIESDSDAKSGIGDGATASKADEQMQADNVAGKLGDSEHVQGTKSQISTRSAALGVAGELNDTTTSSRDKTRAYVGHDTTLAAGNDVDVTATDKTQLMLRATGASGGVVGIGGAIGVGITKSTTEAFVDSSTTIDAVGDVDVAARAGNIDGTGSTVITTAGAGGVVGASASVAVMDDTSATKAYLGGSSEVQQAASLTVEAETARKSRADSLGASVGALAVGASVARATFAGSTSAYLDSGVRVGMAGGGKVVTDVIVDASDASTAIAHATAGTAGILAGSGAVATASVTGQVQAALGDGSEIDAADNVTVSATATPATDAGALGVNIGLGSVGASIATAQSSATTQATLGSGVAVTATSFDLLASREVGAAPSALARATGASGGLLLGANATVALAESSGGTSALVGDNSTLTVSGTTTVKAETNSQQTSSGLGISAGFIALGADYSRANSSSLTQAVLGDGVKLTGNTFQLLATGTDTNYAYGVAGSGGVASAPFSEASTSNTSQTFARTGGGDVTRKIDVTTLLVAADHTARFNSWMDSTNASLIGVSGAKARNSVNSQSEAHLGTSAYVQADNIILQAHNDVLKAPPATIPGLTTLLGTPLAAPAWNVNSSSGGLADFPAAGSSTTIATNALVQVGAGAHLEQTGSKASPGTFALDAWNDVTATDRVKMSSGGAVSAASGKSEILADTNEAIVRVGDFAEMSSLGDMNLGARSVASLYSQAAVDVYGLVGVAPFGSSTARFLAVNAIDIGAGAILDSNHDIKLSAGASSGDAPNNIQATARSDVYNNTAIPVSQDPVADAVIGTQSLIVVGAGADLGAARDIGLYADKGTANASGVGIGKDIYRETLAAIASAISNAFGGDDVSFETRTGRSIKVQGSDVAVNGTVHTGTQREQLLVIGPDGSATQTKGDIRIKDVGWRDVAADIQDRITALDNLILSYTTSDASSDAAIAVAAYESEKKFLQRKLVELGYTKGAVAKSSLSALQVAQQTVAGMNATISNYTTTKNTLTTQNTTLTNDNTTLTSTNTTLTSTNTTLTNQNNTLNTVTIPALVAARAALDPGSSTYTTDYNNLTSQITTAQNTVDTNNTTIGNNNTTISNNNATIATNNTTIAANNTQITTLTTDINRVTAEKDIIQAKIDTNQYSSTPAAGPMATFLTISDATAQLGNIYVRGDRLHGSGTLDSPGDAKITITNNGPNFLILKNLTILPDEGGKVYFNGVDVKGNADINQVNGAVGGAAFTVATAEGSSKPAILVESKYDPLDPYYLAITPADRNALAPDIVLQGDISNLRGSVKVDSAAGSIRLEQKRDDAGNLITPVETAGVRAAEVEIKTRNGDFVQSYSNTFSNTGGSPLAVYKDPITGLKSVVYTPETAGSGIVANGSVLIAARYLNINGIIQSGIPEWGVVVPSGVTVTVPGVGTGGSFAQAQAYYNGLTPAQKAVGGAEYFTVNGTSVGGLTGNQWGAWEKITVRYNAKENRLELAGVQVQGGYIDLFGQIYNTNMAGGGELRVLDGYGQIKVDNQTSMPLWIATLDTGRGVQGQIDITNITGLNADGSPIITTTSYVRGAGASRTGYSYSPTTGLRYAMQVGKTTGRTDNYLVSNGAFFGIKALPDNLADYWVSGWYATDSPIPNNGEFLGQLPSAGTGNHASVTQSTSSASAPVAGASWFECNWWTLCAYGTYYTPFTVESSTRSITTVSLKADNPIGIKFIGQDNGLVNVNSTGNLVLNGSINNRTGNTTLNSAGSITQNGELPLVGGNNVVLAAGTGIGSSGQVLQVNVKDGGYLNATSNAGDVSVKQMLGDMRVGSIGGAGVANVYLEADRSLLNWNASSLVQGQRVELVSDNGGIGILTDSVNDPLQVRTGYTANQTQWPNYGLKATARDSINIKNTSDPAHAGTYSGNLLLIAAESKAGDVRIETTGGVIDNNPYATTDTRTEAELAALWDSLRLRGALAQEKADEAVAAYKRGKETNYQLYWQLRQRQADAGAAYDAGFAFTFTAAEHDALLASGMTAPQIATLAANRTTQYHQLNGEVGSLTTSYVAGYSYTVSAAEDASIRQGSSWTDAQLALSVGAGLLKSITDTVTTIKQPNAKGRSVTLLSGADIGSYDAPQTIDLAAGLGALTTAQKAALAAAERGDASLAGNIITILQPRPVNVSVGSGALKATATGYALIGSEEDLRIDQVSAAGDIRIKTAGSLINAAAVAGAANVVGGDIILEAANGGIGSVPDANGAVSTPLRISQTAGSGLIGRAANDAWIESDGDLLADTLFSRGDLRLGAAGSILDFHAGESSVTPENNLLARNLFLTAQTGSIGTSANHLDAGVGRDGAITATALTVGKGIFLNGPAGEYFNIGSVVAGDAVSLSSATAMKVDGQVTSPGPISLVAGGTLTMTPWADVHATTLGVYLRAGALTMQDAQRMAGNGETLDPKYVPGTDAAQMRVDVGTIDIETVGDALITGIRTGNTTQDAIRVVSTAGRILDNGDTRIDITADQGNARLTISGALGVGNDPLEVKLVNLLASSSGGVVDLAAQGAVNIVDITAADRVLLTADGDITGSTVTSTGAASGTDPANPATGITLASATGSVSLDSVSSAQGVSIAAPTAVTVSQIDVGTTLNLASDQITTSVNGGAAPVGGGVTGFGGGSATSVSLVLSGSGGFALSDFWAVNADVSIPVGALSIANVVIDERATFTNPLTLLLVDQNNKGIQPSDVQLYSDGAPFALGMNANRVSTDAFVIHRDPLHEVLTPDGPNTSVVEQGGNALARLGLARQDGGSGDGGDAGTLVTYTGIPVATEVPCDPERDPDCVK